MSEDCFPLSVLGFEPDEALSCPEALSCLVPDGYFDGGFPEDGKPAPFADWWQSLPAKPFIRVQDRNRSGGGDPEDIKPVPGLVAGLEISF